MQDITARILSEQQTRLFRVLIDGAPDGIMVVDPATLRILDVNQSACVKLGYTHEEFLARRVPDIDMIDPESLKGVLEQLHRDGKVTFESHQRCKDGTTFPVEVTVKVLMMDRLYSMSVARDITERKHAEAEVHKLQEQLREQAVRDPLTGLYNRRYLDEALGREMLRAARYGHPIGIVMCDIDHFKAVNDKYGHAVGDEVLRVSAELLGANARGSDIVCRFGGEEFLLLLPDAALDVTHKRAERLRAELAAKRITLGSAVVQVTASFGVAALPEHGTTSDQLILAADKAMYKAKEAGRDRVVVATARTELAEA